jgi:chloramphenicol-sensitive protein RarD
VSVEPHPARAGVVYALLAYGTWGLIPLYWKAVRSVPAEQLVAHRTLWSLVLLVALMAVRGRLSEVRGLLREARALRLLAASGLLLAGNWLVFLWAIDGDRVLESSLGYYVTPLVNVALGVLLLGERLRPLQGLAVLLAAAAVTYLTLALGAPPWIALALAFTFGLYGLLRKVAHVDALAGLTVETLLLAPLALAFLVHEHAEGRGAFLAAGAGRDVLVAASGIVTALPLLWFAHAARRLRYVTLGQFQYVTPTGHLLLATLVWGEPLAGPRVATFAILAVALALYTFDSLRAARRGARG